MIKQCTGPAHKEYVSKIVLGSQRIIVKLSSVKKYSSGEGRIGSSNCIIFYAIMVQFHIWKKLMTRRSISTFDKENLKLDG